MADVPGWVSVVSGVGGALGAVSAAAVAAFALVLQRRTHGEERERQARQQREQAESQLAAQRSERIWTRRADIYVRVLDAIQPSDGPESGRDKLRASYDLAWPLRSHVHAFASDEVVRAYGTYLDTARAVLAHDTISPETSDAVAAARNALRMAIRISNGVDHADHVEAPFVPVRPPDMPGYGAQPRADAPRWQGGRS